MLRAAKLRKVGFSAVSSCRREPDYFFSVLFPLRAESLGHQTNRPTRRFVVFARRRRKIRELLIRASLGCSIVHSSHTTAVYTTHFRWIISTQKFSSACHAWTDSQTTHTEIFSRSLTVSLHSWIFFSCLSLSVVTLNAWTRNSIVYKTRNNTEIKQSYTTVS